MLFPHIMIALGAIACFGAVLDDIKRRTIPNRYVALTYLIGISASLYGDWSEAAISILISVGLFFALWVLVILNILGGGDAKLIPATSMLVPISSVPQFLAATVFWGGAIATCFLLSRSLLRQKGMGGISLSSIPHAEPKNPWSLRDQIAAGVPYGVAIWLGLVTVYYQEINL